MEYFSNLVRNGKVLPPSISLSITKLSVRLISPDNLQNLYQLAPFASVTRIQLLILVVIKYLLFLQYNDGKPVNGVLMKRKEKCDTYQESSIEYYGPDIPVVNDVRLMVFLEEKNPNPKTGKRREIYFFYFWFHTGFVNPVYPLVLSKHEVLF